MSDFVNEVKSDLSKAENAVVTTAKSTWKRVAAVSAAVVLAAGLFLSDCGKGCGTAESPDAGSAIAASVDAAPAAAPDAAPAAVTVKVDAAPAPAAADASAAK